jgi:hypothetical protein
MSFLPPEVGDTVLVPSGRHQGETGTLVSTNERGGPDGHSHVGTVLLPDGSLLGPVDVDELVRADGRPEAG